MDTPPLATRTTTRRGFLAASAGAVALATLAGCGKDSSSTAGASASARTFTDAVGRSVQLPARAERIVALHEYSGGHALLSIGAPVVGINSRNGRIDPMLSKYDTSKMVTVGEVGQPNIEAIASLKPDLIVGLATKGKPNFTDQGVVGKIAALAPTVFLDQLVPVDEFMKNIGTVSGRMDEVDKQRAAWDKEFAAAKDELGAQTKDLSVAYVGWFDPTFYIATSAHPDPTIQILKQVGAYFPPVTVPLAAKGETWAELSSERIDQALADVFIWQDGGGDPTHLPLWKNLPAVKAGQVHHYTTFPPGGSYDSYHEALANIRGFFKGSRHDVVDERSWKR